MKLSLPLSLSALAVVLAGVIAGQLAADPYAAPPDLPVAAVPAVMAQPVSGLVTPDVAAGRMRVVLARPLFRRDRRPPAPAEVAPVAAEAIPRLTAVLSGPFGDRAIFAGANGRSTVATVGSAVGGWTVQAIEGGAVLVSGRDGERTIRLAFGVPKPASRAVAEPPDEHAGGELLRRPTAGPMFPAHGSPVFGRR